MKNASITSLKKELENSFGRKIVSSRDCNQLVEEIYRKTGETVNANTLRRFFGLVKAEYPPSSSTITILVRYCGFNSIADLETATHTDDPVTHINKQEVLRYLVSLFRNTIVTSGQERTFYPMVEQTIVFLERNPTLIDRFQREIAKTTTGQYYYYEKLANLDRLNDYYGDGLRHYLREKNNEEGRLFAHSMQVFRYWLTRNRELLFQHIAEMSAVVPASNLPDHILGRMIAAKLYHANVRNEAIDSILAEAKRYHAAIIARREDTAFSFPDFELIICEALILTGHPDEGAEYIWHGRNFLAASGQEKDSPFNLWQYYLAKRKSGKRTLVKNGNGDTVLYFDPFSRRFGSIIALLADISVKANRNQEEQIRQLVKETGYKHLLSLAE